MLLRLQSNSMYGEIAGKLLWSMVIPALTLEWSCIIYLSLLLLWILSGATTATTTPALLKGLFSLWMQQDNYCITISEYFYLGIQHVYYIIIILRPYQPPLPTPFTYRPCLHENFLPSVSAALILVPGDNGRKTHAKTPRPGVS